MDKVTGPVGGNLLRLWDAGNCEMCWRMASGMGLLPDFVCLLSFRRIRGYMCPEDEMRVYSCFGSVVVVGAYGEYGDGCCWEFVISRGCDAFVEWLETSLGWFLRSEVDPRGQDIVANDGDWECGLIWKEYRAHPGSNSYHGCGDGYVDDYNHYPVDEFYRWRPLY